MNWPCIKIVNYIKYTVHCAWTFAVYIHVHVIVWLITVRILCMIVIYIFIVLFFKQVYECVVKLQVLTMFYHVLNDYEK